MAYPLGELSGRKRRVGVKSLRKGFMFTPAGMLTTRLRPTSATIARHRPQGLSGVMDFLSPQHAIDYIKAKVGAFFQLPYEYSQAKKKIPVLVDAAKKKNDLVTVAKLTALDTGVSTLQSSYPSIESKVKSFLDTLKSYGLGFIPLLVAGLAITVGGAVAYQLVTWGKLKTELNAIEKGTVGEGFFNKPLFGLGIPTWIPLVGVGAIGVWWFTRRKRS